MPEFGPYEQPGWPTTLPYYRPGEAFQSAFRTAAEVNRRKQQLENQMMAMSLRAQNQEIQNQIRVAEYERKLSQGDQRLAWQQHESYVRDMFTQKRLDDRDKVIQKAQDVIQDTRGFNQYMLDSGVTMDSPAYPATLRQAMVLNPNAPRQLAEDGLRSFNSRRNDLEASTTADEKHILENAQKDIFHGRQVDAGIFTQPDRTYRNYKVEQSEDEKKLGVTPPPWPAGAKKRVDAATGQWTDVRYVKDPKTGAFVEDNNTRSVLFPAGSNDPAPTFLPVTMGQFKQYQDRLKAVYDKRAQIPNPAKVDTNPANAIRIYSRDQYDKLPPGQAFIWNATGEQGHKPDQ